MDIITITLSNDYIVIGKNGDGFAFEWTKSDPYEKLEVEAWDQMLYGALENIFRTRCRTSGEIKELIRGRSVYTNKKSIFDEILKREPTLSWLLAQKNDLSLLWLTVLSCLQDSSELLVRYGADGNELCGQHMNWAVTEKSTLLHVLAQMYPSSWKNRLCRLLIERGVDWNARDANGDTVVQTAMKKGCAQLINHYYKTGADVNAVDYRGMTPLLEAAVGSRNPEKLIKVLIRRGADVHARDLHGKNVLHQLALNMREDLNLAWVAGFLIDKGVSMYDRDSKHYHPIHLAICSGKMELVEVFLKHGMNVNERSPLIPEEFLLHFVVKKSESSKIIITLFQYGANIDRRDKWGWTALHVACENTRNPNALIRRKIGLLLYFGADMFLENNDGWDSFDLIQSKLLAQSLMVKTVALRKARLPPTVEFRDERILKERHCNYWKYYQDCINEIARTKSKKITESCTLFDLLTGCHCSTAHLMRVPKVRDEFENYDLSNFPLYANNMREAYDFAKSFYKVEMAPVINAAVRNILSFRSSINVNVVRHYIPCKFCEIKKLVQDCRSP
ncbi:hypothetical protein TSAR_013048 [Trichomalopsis sarcophagae]|uniref:Uncharacterized protein n=1 Tax=Trichomalopsis sarcophagae TaxID=543379 RepID=A0A232FL76_9HYME|nr:hypothetical protein TSAR_013048 [Trichomalopsis sarcophagae]